MTKQSFHTTTGGADMAAAERALGPFQGNQPRRPRLARQLQTPPWCNAAAHQPVVATAPVVVFVGAVAVVAVIRANDALAVAPAQRRDRVLGSGSLAMTLAPAAAAAAAERKCV